MAPLIRRLPLRRSLPTARAHLGLDLALVRSAIPLVGHQIASLRVTVALVRRPLPLVRAPDPLGEGGVSALLAFHFLRVAPVLGDLSLVRAPLALVGQRVSHLGFELTLVRQPVALVR